MHRYHRGGGAVGGVSLLRSLCSLLETQVENGRMLFLLESWNISGIFHQ